MYIHVVHVDVADPVWHRWPLDAPLLRAVEGQQVFVEVDQETGARSARIRAGRVV